MTYSQKQIIEAIANCPSEYMLKSLEQRNPGPLSAGSVFNTPQTRESLMAQDWMQYPDPDCQAPAISFRTRLPGKLGIASLADLPSDMKVKLRPAHKSQVTIKDEESEFNGQLDTELVGNVSEFLTKVGYTTLLCGPTEENELQFWTMFPGPCSFSWPKIGFQSLQAQFQTSDSDSISVTVEQAIKLGFNNIKHSTEC